MQLDTFKRGDTFLLTIDLVHPETQEPLILDPEFIRSQVRNRNNILIVDLVITNDPQSVAGRYELTCADTTNWPVGDLYMDIEVNRDGIISSTDTITVPVVKDVTLSQ